MTNFQCEEDDTCLPDCHGKQCGDNGCGGACGTCPPGYLCGDSFKCAPDMPAGPDTSTPGMDTTGEPDVGGCEEGYSLLYGNCVPDDEIDGGTSSGCAMAPGRDTETPAIWLLVGALLGFIALRRRGQLVEAPGSERKTR